MLLTQRVKYCRIKSFKSCGLYRQYQSNLCSCAVLQTSIMCLCLAVKAQPPEFQREGLCLGMNQGGTVKEAQMPIVDASVCE